MTSLISVSNTPDLVIHYRSELICDTTLAFLRGKCSGRGPRAHPTERTARMKGKGNDEETKGAATQAAAQENGTDDKAGEETPPVDYAAELANRDATIAERDAKIVERDGRITELEGQLAEASKLGELNEALKSENERLKNQAASDRIDFSLQIAGCRNVKAARAVLDDYDGDVEKLKAAESWLFAAYAEATGATGLPNAGAAKDDGKDERRWRRLAGLSQKKSND